MKNYLKFFDEEGRWLLSDNYKSILELEEKLTEKDIPHELIRLMDGWQIAYPSHEKMIFDVIEHRGSYGHERDLMEAYGKYMEDVEGWLDVEAALALFIDIHGKVERGEVKVEL